MKSIIIIIFFLFQIIESKDSNEKLEGKCIYMEKKSGSEIINFRNLGENMIYSTEIDEQEKNKWKIQLCNDTNYIYNDNETKCDSQIVYQDKNKPYILLSGPFYKIRSDNFKIKLSKSSNNPINYIFYSQPGQICNQTNNQTYNTTINYIEKENIENMEINTLPNISNCETSFEVDYNPEKVKDYLLVQIVLNDGYIFTGIIFIILGIYICFISYKFLNITKVVVSIIFGQIVIFGLIIIISSNQTQLKYYIFILAIGIGALFGGGMSVLSLKFNKIYLILLAFSSGFIFALFSFDIFFITTLSVLSEDIFIDSLLIFIISFIYCIIILPKNSRFYPPVIGSYLLIRGLSLFIYNGSGVGGFIDIQLILYFAKNYEVTLLNEYLDNEYKYFWIYLIVMGITLIGSEFLAYRFNPRSDSFIADEDEDEEDDNHIKEELNTMTSLQQE